MYRSQLHSISQLVWGQPQYSTVSTGTAHAPRFKAVVRVGLQQYESPKDCYSIREAQEAAAKVALDFLRRSETPYLFESAKNGGISHKNLLQEYTQKRGLPLPVYSDEVEGLGWSLGRFAASVTVQGTKFTGGAAATKKQAQQNAARVALQALQGTEGQDHLEAQSSNIGLPRQAAAPQDGAISDVFQRPSIRKALRAAPFPVSGNWGLTALDVPTTARRPIQEPPPAKRTRTSYDRYVPSSWEEDEEIVFPDYLPTP